MRQDKGVRVLGLVVEALIRIFTGRDSVYDTCEPD